MKSSDAIAKSFTRPAYSVPNKGGKSVLIMKETLWKSIPNFVKFPKAFVSLETCIVLHYIAA